MTTTKRLLCLLLCFVMGVMCVLFSGCSLEDLENAFYDHLEDNLKDEKLDKSFFENYVGGFNTVYASSQYGTPRKIEDNLNKLIVNLNEGILANYGSINNSTYLYNNGFPDSIRMLVYEDQDGKAKVADKTSASLSPTNDISKFLSWNWNFDLYWLKSEGGDLVKQNELYNLAPGSNESYNDWKTRVLEDEYDKIESSSYQFPNFMQDLFQIVLYEIMLGYDTTKINVELVEGEYVIGERQQGYFYRATIDETPCKSLEKTTLYENFSFKKNGTYKSFTLSSYEQNDDAKKSIDAYIKRLAEEYKNSTLYNGLTKQNADKLIDYILKEIIGENVVNYDYSNFRDQPVNYRNYVSTIAYLIYSQTYDGSGDLWEYEYSSGSVKLSYKFTPAQRVKAMNARLLNEDGVDVDTAWSGNEENPTIITEVQAGFSAKPATFVRYYEGETFFGDDVEDQFAGRPYVEYQSIVIDPAYTLENAKTRGLELEAGFCFNFMTKNKNLKIAMKVRYFIYDSATGTGQLYEFECDTVNFTDGATVYTNANGETCYENDFEASIDTAELERYNPSLVRHESTENDPDVTHFTVPYFDSSEIIRSASKGEVGLSEAKNIAKLYKVIESEKGYGGLTVLDEKRVKTSFYEVVLDVIKSPEDTNTDYRFSMVLSNTVLSPGIW